MKTSDRHEIYDIENPRVASFRPLNAQLRWFLDFVGHRIGHGDLNDKNKCQKWDLRYRKPSSSHSRSSNRNFQAAVIFSNFGTGFLNSAWYCLPFGHPPGGRARPAKDASVIFSSCADIDIKSSFVCTLFLFCKASKLEVFCESKFLFSRIAFHFLQLNLTPFILVSFCHRSTMRWLCRKT